MATYLFPAEPQPDRILFGENAERALHDQLIGFGDDGIFVVTQSRKKLLAVEHPVTFVPWSEITAFHLDRHRALLAGILGLLVTVGTIGLAIVMVIVGEVKHLFNLIYLFIIGLGIGPALLFGISRVRLQAETGDRTYRFTSKPLQTGIREMVQELLCHCLFRGVALRSNLLDAGEQTRHTDDAGNPNALD